MTPDNKRILALITARAGSKGLPGKNIKKLCGKALIEYSIDAALNSDFVDKVCVSTDGNEIADVSRKAGASVIMRPPELAADNSKSEDAVLHAISYLEERGEYFDIILLLQPTSPLRTNEHIDQAIEQFSKEGKNALLSIRETEHSPFKCFVEADGGMEPLMGEDKLFGPRQMLPKTYRDAGAIYLVACDFFKRERRFYHKNCSFFKFPANLAADIDSELDFVLAEAIIKKSSQT